ncbi:hypothetical protein ACFSHT_11795 [Paraburkholderia silviterrae]|uniref:Lipoprotein n=1 Tax=Paraburkholderia silviterrae TaxID=2528715 RepID=A0A4R5MEP2_9BURK|nr:hypothetical protein [Paraburkholderia silviterrae]TDG25610.1 hypothetical protein EYW47_07280 [Paraburkholderia silviterrae]
MALVSNRGLCAAVLLVASAAAHAGIDCSGSRGGFRFMTSDSWVDTDKLEHFGASVPFGALGGWLTRDTDHPIIYGTLIGTVPGLAKQTFDGTCRTDGFSYKDLFADTFGALTGAWLAHWALIYSREPRSRTIGLQYDNTF